MKVLQDYYQNGSKIFARTATDEEIASGSGDNVLVTLEDVIELIDLNAIFSPNLDGGLSDSNYGASPEIDGGDSLGS